MKRHLASNVHVYLSRCCPGWSGSHLTVLIIPPNENSKAVTQTDRLLPQECMLNQATLTSLGHLFASSVYTYVEVTLHSQKLAP